MARQLDLPARLTVPVEGDGGRRKVLPLTFEVMRPGSDEYKPVIGPLALAGYYKVSEPFAPLQKGAIRTGASLLWTLHDNGTEWAFDRAGTYRIRAAVATDSGLVYSSDAVVEVTHSDTADLGKQRMRAVQLALLRNIGSSEELFGAEPSPAAQKVAELLDAQPDALQRGEERSTDGLRTLTLRADSPVIALLAAKSLERASASDSGAETPEMREARAIRTAVDTALREEIDAAEPKGD